MTAKFKTAKIFVGAGIMKTAKFNARQYFCIYGMSCIKYANCALTIILVVH